MTFKSCVVFVGIAVLLSQAAWAASGAKPAGKRYQGTVDALQGRKIHMTMKDGSTGDWTVAPGVSAELGKKALPLQDVKPGYRVTVFVKDDGTVDSLRIVSYPMNNPPEAKGAPARRPRRAASAPAPKQATAAASKLGELETVRSNDGKKLVLANAGANSSGSETLSIGPGDSADIAPSLPVRAGGRTMRLSDLKPGMKVKVRWSQSTGRPEAIEVQR